VKQMGNIQFLLLTVGGVVFLTLLLVTGNTMAMAVRERISELGVLKALGWTDRALLLLIEAEIGVQALIGGGLGVLAAWFTVPALAQALPGMIFHLSLSELLAGSLLALGIGGVAGLLPALSAARLSVVTALRRVA
ncbi:MAG: ABC transporter permease, partial [Acidobacteria bacterium]|nr:ABC transporter permease [Acidobacteriota bacterium]MDW7985060.1 ABC transporter permease [Acidobacteriota bacterium]